MSELWMQPQEPVTPPFFVIYRNLFHLDKPGTLQFIYSADERAQIFCDGERIADGPARGTIQQWFCDKVQIALQPGTHVLVARVYAFGSKLTAYGQMSIRPGFMVRETTTLLNNRWEYQTAMDCRFESSKTDWGAFAHILAGDKFNHLALHGESGEWLPVEKFEDCRNMKMSDIPPMRFDEIQNYERVGNVFLFDDYVCVYGDYEFSGTGTVRLRWAEPGCRAAEWNDAFMHGRKPNDSVDYFSGSGDQFTLSNQKIRWRDYWWHAGRTLEITTTGNVEIVSARFRHTGYPYRLNRELNVPGDERMTRLLNRSWRTLEVCSFETVMDCPYYEQLQYIGDSRLDFLSLYEICDDFRLIEKALRQFAEGQYPSGAMSCRYPTKDFIDYEPQMGEYYRIHIPSFTAIYIQMVHDFARLRENDGLVRELMPVLRKASGYLESTIGEDGLLHTPGWNFIDWLSNWEAGIPPECRYGEGCTLNLIYVLALKDLADLERHFGREENAVNAEMLAEKLAAAIYAAYYDTAKGCFAENKSHSYFSEHAQVFALLALGETSVIRSLYEDSLDECGIAFSFYYMEICRIHHLDDLFRNRLEKYLMTADAPQLRTMPELFLNNWWLRSDCHAWGSHCIYHHFAEGSILDRISTAISARPYKKSKE